MPPPPAADAQARAPRGAAKAAAAAGGSEAAGAARRAASALRGGRARAVRRVRVSRRENLAPAQQQPAQPSAQIRTLRGEALTRRRGLRSGAAGAALLLRRAARRGWRRRGEPRAALRRACRPRAPRRHAQRRRCSLPLTFTPAERGAVLLAHSAGTVAQCNAPSGRLSRRLPPLDAGLRSGWSPPCVPCPAQRWAPARLAPRRASPPPLHSLLRRARVLLAPPRAPPPSCAAAAWRRARAGPSCSARWRVAAAVALPRPRCARCPLSAAAAAPGRDVLQSPREGGRCASGGWFRACSGALLTRVRACVASRLWPCRRRRLGRCRCRPTCTASRWCARSTSRSTTPRPCCTGTRKPALRHAPKRPEP